MPRYNPHATPADIARDVKTVKECLAIARRHTHHTPLLRSRILSALKSCDSAMRWLRAKNSPEALEAKHVPIGSHR